MANFDLKTASILIPVMDGQEVTTEKNIQGIEMYDSCLVKPEDKKLLIYFDVYQHTSADIRLRVHQRRCRFKHESELKHSPVYSYNFCLMECRVQLCLQYCQCIPHFYRRIGDEEICDVKGLHCIFEHKDVLMELKRDKDGKKVDCKCYPMCHDARYTIQSFALEQWVLGTNFQWGMVTYPRVRYRRDIMFGFTDVLVAFGGMAGLFLGCSVLSFAEIVYFTTLRLIFYAKNTKDAAVPQNK